VPDSLALDRLMDPQFPPSESAIVESTIESNLSGPTATAEPGQIIWEERGINSQRLRVSTSEPALLVISDNFYPAWHATIDGDPVPLVRADYTLRAVPIPAGTHEVRIAYRSSLLLAALWTTVVSGLVCALVVAAGVVGVQRNVGGGGARSGERAT
jgi:hypothetical protein